jgi:hypothetical protein
VLKNRVPRREFEPKRDEVTGEWRKLHNEELNDLYFTPNFSPFGKSNQGDGRCTQHVWARKEVHTGYCWGNVEERGHLEDPTVDRRIILKWIFRMWYKGGMDWIDLVQHRSD